MPPFLENSMSESEVCVCQHEKSEHRPGPNGRCTECNCPEFTKKSPEPKKCPKCGASMGVLLFMGAMPEYYICPKCNISYDIYTLEPRGTLIGDYSCKSLVLLRGLPGSGKSYVAKIYRRKAEADGLSAIVCSADDYFMESGVYVYRPEDQSRAHSACQTSAERSMANGIDVVIIDNTNVKNAHMQPYRDMAKKYGYAVITRMIGSTDPEYVELYLSRQVHNVPRKTVERMAREFEPEDQG